MLSNVLVDDKKNHGWKILSTTRGAATRVGVIKNIEAFVLLLYHDYIIPCDVFVRHNMFMSNYCKGIYFLLFSCL